MVGNEFYPVLPSNSHALERANVTGNKLDGGPFVLINVGDRYGRQLLDEVARGSDV